MTKIGIRLGLDVGDLVSHAGRASGALDKITEAMKKAHDAGDTDAYGKLAYEKDRMTTRAAGFNRDIRAFANNPMFQGVGANGQPVFKVDQKYADLITKQIDVMKKLTDAYYDKLDDGTADEVMALSSQLSKEQNEFHKLIEKATGTGVKNDAVGEAIKGIALNQIVGAIKNGLDIWTSSVDRTAVINSMGGGNMLGASLAERQRRTNRITGVLDTTGAVAQGVGTALAPFTGGISLIAGTAANVLTKVFSTLSEAEQKIYANRIAFSTLWDQHKEDAMRLAAMSGDPSFVRGSWKTAADVSEKYGYSAEEGAEMLKKAAYQGLGGDAVDKVFRYERATGADREALSSLSFISGRYGSGDALGAAWRGLNASGMDMGRLNEMLRSMQRAVEDGISKGYIRSTDQVARNLAMLARMTNNDPLWTGEQGMNRLMKLNSGVAGAVGMQSSEDVMAFRAAKRAMQNSDEWKGREIPYYEVMKTVEQGFSGKYGTKFWNEFNKVIREANPDDQGALHEIFVKMGFSYNEAGKLTRWREGTNDPELDKIIASKAKALPEAGSPELKASVESMEVQNLVVRAGMKFWDEDMFASIKEARRAYQETTGKLLPDAGNTDISDMAKVMGLSSVDSVYEMTPYIKTRSTAVISDYFRGRGEQKERDKLGAMFDRASSETELTAGFRTLQILDNFPAPVRQRWDRENTLNPVVNNSSTLEQILDALRQLIDVEEKNGEASVEIINSRR